MCRTIFAGVVTGKFYNMHQDWSKAPEWVKEHYKIEEQQHCGDISEYSTTGLSCLGKNIYHQSIKSEVAEALAPKQICFSAHQ